MSKFQRSAQLVGLVATAALIALPGSAAAVDYPPPSKPSAKPSKPKGPFKTINVCAKKGKKVKNCTKTIQAAVKRANPGDTIRIPAGTYKEQVSVVGKGKRYIKLVGNPKKPSSVVLEGSGKKANGVFVNGADGVTVNGMTALHYKANGFFLTNVNGYTLTNLVAGYAGVYGLYAFNSIGGTMTNSTAYANNDSGFYVGQTPKQTKPVRTTIKNVVSYANVLGYSGTNSRYVTITDSKWFNNGAGIVPNSLDSEKWPPDEDNVITRNEVFWNNFNYYKGAPFKTRDTSVAGQIPFPVGVGILVFGGRGNEVTRNKVYGNYLVGAALIPAVTLKNQADGVLKDNKVTDNEYGLGGADRNGIDIAYPGGGTGNCFGTLPSSVTLAPANPANFPGCAPGIVNPNDDAALGQMFDWALNPDHEAHWVRSPHVAKKGYTPLETYTKGSKLR